MALWGEKRKDFTPTKEDAKQKLTGADLIAKFLAYQGVNQIYGIPGAAILPVYDSILKEGRIKSYNVRHEQTAVFMADGYYRATGKIGVCACTSGPAATNFLTGLYSAYADSVPLIAMTGQVPNSLIGKDAFQEAPITEMAKPVTKAAYQVQKIEDLPHILKEAWKKATTGRRGPVLLDLPLDIQKSSVEIHLDDWLQEETKKEILQVSENEIENVLLMIKEAKKPVLMAGGGVNLAGACNYLYELAELLDIPVVSTLMGKDAFPNDHPLYAGMIGTTCQTPLGNKTILDSDLVINLGGRFSDRSTGDLKVFTEGRKFIHVNIDYKELNRQVKTELAVRSDLKDFLKKLCGRIKETSTGEFCFEWDRYSLQKDKTKYMRKTDYDCHPMKPQKAIAELRKHLQRDAIVTHDCGISQILSSQLFEAYEPRTYLITGRAGSMGWGLGAAMAAKLAKPEVQCVNIVGDGSLGMSLADIATAVKHNIPVVIFLLNNSLLGLIRQQQNLFFDRNCISTDLEYTNSEFSHTRGLDFVSAAKAMGAGAEMVERPEQIGEALARAFKAGKPYLLELLVDPKAMCSVSMDGSLKGVAEYV